MNKFTKHILLPAASVFTVITVGYAAIIYAAFGGLEGGANLSALRTLMFFVFSFLLAAANYLLTLPSLPAAAKVALHAIITGFGFWLCMLLPADIHGSKALTGMVVFYAIYAAILIPVSAVRSKKSKKKTEKQQYTSMFGKKD